MQARGSYPRLNIYLDDRKLRERIKSAAAREGVTLSSYCLEAVRRRLAEEGLLPGSESQASRRKAARALDRLRRKIGPVGVPARELIAQGRR